MGRRAVSEYRYQEAHARANPSISLKEADYLLTCLQSVDVRHVLEIGTHRGCSARLWRDVLRPELLITVDWEPMLDGQDMDGIVVVRGNRSQDPVAQQAVREALAGRNVDFLFIDGGHRYEDVRDDYRAYGPYVRRGGIVAFHDIDVSNEEHDVGRLWRALVGDPGTITTEVHDDAGTGMGVLWA